MYTICFFSFTAQSPSSSGESNDDDDKDSKSEDESDSSDDTFVKENYYSSSSVWRSYTTRGQVKGNKEGELVASLGAVKFGVFSKRTSSDNVTMSENNIKVLV